MGAACSVNNPNEKEDGHSPSARSKSISTQTLLTFGSLNLSLEQIEGMKRLFGLELPITEIEQAPAIILLPPKANRKESIQTVESSSLQSIDDIDSENSSESPEPIKQQKPDSDKKNTKNQKKMQESSEESGSEEEVEPIGEPEEDEEEQHHMVRKESAKDSQLSAIVKTLTCRKKNDQGVPVFFQFEMVRTLGHGAFGKVKLAKNIKTGELIAVKQIKKKNFDRGSNTHRMQRFLSFSTLLKEQKQQEEEQQRLNNGNGDYQSSTTAAISENSLIREIAILKKLNHDNIVKLFDVVEDENASSIFLVEEFCENGTLTEIGAGGRSKKNPFDEKQSRKYILDLLKALRYLHCNGVIHLDIKPENLLLTKSDVLKLSDFGVSHIFEGDNDFVSTTLGTPAFSAPETCELEPFRGRPADIWSAGVVLFAFVFGQLPFYSDNPFVLARDIQTKPLNFPHPVSSDLENLLLRMLEKDPTKRINMEELFQHPFITENGTVNVTDINLITLSHASITKEELQNAILPGTSAFRIETMKKFRAALTMSKVVTQMKKNIASKFPKKENEDGPQNPIVARLRPKPGPLKTSSLLDALKKAADKERQSEEIGKASEISAKMIREHEPGLVDDE